VFILQCLAWFIINIDPPQCCISPDLSVPWIFSPKDFSQHCSYFFGLTSGMHISTMLFLKTIGSSKLFQYNRLAVYIFLDLDLFYQFYIKKSIKIPKG
jgi:hypothetical protein